MKKNWQKSPAEIFNEFAIHSHNVKKGLTEEEAIENLENFGKNKLPEKKRSLIKIFLSQFADFLIAILFTFNSLF